MFKKVFVLLLVFVMTVFFAGCAANQDPVDEVPSEAGNTGGWTLAENEACELPDEVQAAFDKAMEQFTGNMLKPVAYVANQVVSGINYMILCESKTVTAEPVVSYDMVTVYADVKGNAEIKEIKDFEIESYTGGDNVEVSTEQLAGGWSVAENAVGSAIPKDAQEIFLKASEGFTGSGIEPLALLGTQVVSGVKYAFICKSTMMAQTPITSIQIVTVYADVKGNAEITGITAIDPADFNK